MAYRIDTYRFSNSNEIEVKYSGRYGAKGEKRAPKRKASPEQIKKQNQWRKEVYSRRVMKLNFFKGDLWCTILYPKGTRKGMDGVKKDMGDFLKKLRPVYRKREDILKFMYRIEIGSRGGIHIHMLCNHTRGEPPIDMEIQKAWTQGRVSFERFGGEEEDYERLGSYLVKPQNEEQMDRLPPEERKVLRAYSTSRNLERPKPERKDYKRRTLRKVMEEGPKPAPGYYISKESIRSGINPYTGMSYLYYTEIRIDPGGGSG
ncbi:MAG: hypothetical protein NC094_09045 [Bacteroidales bacterium]|nr:hypothetical protein [Lachnoclostridium sp.]MCM1385150.1 hypothetical protein [Lachnoclostridium sp.]MCM1465552.1 hypothetical protein [Bacteroidales bacterium]